jgi:hypothetical protein
MCTTPCPKCKKVLGTLAGDEAVHTAFARVAVGAPAVVAVLPVAVAKKDWTFAGAPAPVANAVGALPAAVGKKAGTVDGTPTPVAKASKEYSPATADVAAPAKVVAVPAPVMKVPGSFHPTSVVVEIVGIEVGDRGHSCEEHASNYGEVMAKNVVVRLWKVQIQVKGQEETAITAYWVTDCVDRCHVGFLPCHMVRQAACYNGALVQVTRVFSDDPTCCDTAERRKFHKNEGCSCAAIVAW